MDFVYFIRGGPLTKIGRSTDVRKRLAALQTSSPTPLTLVHTVLTNDGPMLEAHYHTIYSRQRRRGEWFDLTDDDLRKIQAARHVLIGVCGGNIRTQLYKGSPAYYCETCDRPHCCNGPVPSVSVTAGVYPHHVCMKPAKRRQPTVLA